MCSETEAGFNSFDYFQEKYRREKQQFLDELDKTPPVDCDFKVGDVVTFTNDYGISFEGKTVIGFSKKENMFNGRFIHWDNEAYWFPAHPDQLKKEDSSASQQTDTNTLH